MPGLYEAERSAMPDATGRAVSAWISQRSALALGPDMQTQHRTASDIRVLAFSTAHRQIRTSPTSGGVTQLPADPQRRGVGVRCAAVVCAWSTIRSRTEV
jgi:hypothetical protein